MPYVLVRHKVEDWAKWKPLYDQHGATRKASGCQGTQVFRNDENPNEVIVLLEWDDLGKARQFAASEDLRETMQRAGVVDRPDIYFLNDAGRTTE
jgi:heme-degrading monooxygenase HmoA